MNKFEWDPNGFGRRLVERVKSACKLIWRVGRFLFHCLWPCLCTAYGSQKLIEQLALMSPAEAADAAMTPIDLLIAKWAFKLTYTYFHTRHDWHEAQRGIGLLFKQIVAAYLLARSWIRSTMSHIRKWWESVRKRK